MKTEIINSEAGTIKTINWDNRMVVQSNEGATIMTTGEHSKDKFSGYIIHDKKEGYDVFCHSSGWYKSAFTPITEPITIKFIP